MTVEEIQILLEQAESVALRDSYDKAEQQVLHALNMLEGMSPSSEESRDVLVLSANAKRILGVISSRRGDYTKALEFLEKALQVSTAVEDKLAIAKVMGSIGFVQMNRSDYTKALEYHTDALRIDEELDNRVGIARHLCNIGIVHWHISDYPKALEYYGRALNMEEILGNEANVARLLGQIGIIHHNLSDYTKALEYYTRALGIDEKLGNKSGISRHLGNIGSVHRELSDYSKALEYHFKALNIDEELGNKAGIAVHLGNIGIVYRHLSEHRNSLEYYRRSLSIAEEMGSKALIALNLGNIGIVQQNLSDYPKSLEYHGKALSIDEELGNKEGIARHLGNIGTVLTKLSDFAKAQEYLDRSYRILEELGDKAHQGDVLAALGELYSKPNSPNKDEDSAELYLLRAIELYKQLGAKSYHVHKLLANLYKQQERWKECTEQLIAYQDLKDEVLSDEAKQSATQMEQRRLIAEREKEIAIAKAAADAQMSATTSLLYKVLPESVATRMISGDNEIADYYPQISILFADIAGFTPLSADMPAIIVVRFLNFVFAEFDRIIKKHGCEKIKTIGDGYMAVCGAPIECPDHAERLAAAAVEMQQTIVLPDSIREHLPDDTKLGVRIGLHTGSVVAGVIGEERFVYDIYSDAVNIAARMESHGEENKIHCSNDFYRHMQNRFAMTKNTTHGLSFVKRGEMEIKGKGLMRTYFMEKVS